MEEFKDLVKKRRTIRRFSQKPIPLETLREFIDLARLAPMGKNIQPVDFAIVNKKDICAEIFPLLGWAAQLPKEKRNPEPGREPTAYLVVLVNTSVKSARGAECDLAAAVENILLGATALGIGTCWQRSVNTVKLKLILEIPDVYFIHSVISIGFPDENAQIEEFKGDFAYWKDEEGDMHVPKRSLDEVVWKTFTN